VQNRRPQNPPSNFWKVPLLHVYYAPIIPKHADAVEIKDFCDSQHGKVGC
jgi:hypothetical protein